MNVLSALDFAILGLRRWHRKFVMPDQSDDSMREQIDDIASAIRTLNVRSAPAYFKRWDE